MAAAGLAAGLWVGVSRQWLDSHSPIPLSGLTAEYLGAWRAFVAVAAIVALGGIAATALGLLMNTDSARRTHHNVSRELG